MINRRWMVAAMCGAGAALLVASVGVGARTDAPRRRDPVPIALSDRAGPSPDLGADPLGVIVVDGDLSHPPSDSTLASRSERAHPSMLHGARTMPPDSARSKQLDSARSATLTPHRAGLTLASQLPAPTPSHSAASTSLHPAASTSSHPATPAPGESSDDGALAETPMPPLWDDLFPAVGGASSSSSADGARLQPCFDRLQGIKGLSPCPRSTVEAVNGFAAGAR